jgi:hypothetical protein
MCDYTRGLDWWIDLLTTYRSWLQITIILLLIFIFYSTLQHTVYSSQSLTRRFSVTAPTMVIPLSPDSNPPFTDSRTELLSSESGLLYFTANQFVLAASPLRITTRLFSTEHLRSLSLCYIHSDERMGLSFTISACPHQRSHSQVRVPLDLCPHFTVSD